MPQYSDIIDPKMVAELTELTQFYQSLTDSKDSLTPDVSLYLKALQKINPEKITYDDIKKLSNQGEELRATIAQPEREDESTFVTEILGKLQNTMAYKAIPRILVAVIPRIAMFLAPPALNKLAHINNDFRFYSEQERSGRALLRHVIDGNTEAIAAMLHEDPKRILYRSNITNTLGQTFINVNAFELALHPHQLADLSERGTLSDAEEVIRRVDALFRQPYSEEIKQTIKKNLGKQLLHHVIRGNQQAVVEILKRYPDLLTYRGNVVDNSGREFKNVTAFELALWALDVRHMAPAMLKCLTQNEAHKDYCKQLLPELQEQYINVTKQGGGVEYTIGCGLLKVSKDPNQLPEAERNKLLNQLLDCHNGCIQFGDKLFYFNNHGSSKSLVEITHTDDIIALQSIMNRTDRPLEQDTLQITRKEDELSVIERVSNSPHQFKENHYDFTPLITALQEYVDNYLNWTDEERIAHWCTVVALLQRYIPAHVAQHYCNPNESFVQTHTTDTPPTFKEQTLKRTLILYNNLENQLVSWWPMRAVAGSEVLGVDFGNLRGARDGECGCARGERGLSRLGAAMCDLTALTALCKMRTSELPRLKALLDSLQKLDAGFEPAQRFN